MNNIYNHDSSKKIIKRMKKLLEREIIKLEDQVAKQVFNQK